MLEPGTLKPVTEAVVPGGTVTSSSMVPVAGTPGVVVSMTGEATNGEAAGVVEEVATIQVGTDTCRLHIPDPTPGTATS